MWIYSKSRSENDNRLLLNLGLSTRINLIQLGEKWFLEAVLGSESYPIAAVNSHEEALEIQKRIFDAIKAGDAALDLEAPAPPDQ